LKLLRLIKYNYQINKFFKILKVSYSNKKAIRTGTL